MPDLTFDDLKKCSPATLEAFAQSYDKLGPNHHDPRDIEFLQTYNRLADAVQQSITESGAPAAPALEAYGNIRIELNRRYETLYAARQTMLAKDEAQFKRGQTVMKFSTWGSTICTAVAIGALCAAATGSATLSDKPVLITAGFAAAAVALLAVRQVGVRIRNAVSRVSQSRGGIRILHSQYAEPRFEENDSLEKLRHFKLEMRKIFTTRDPFEPAHESATPPVQLPAHLVDQVLQLKKG